MECNKDNALKAKELAERKLLQKELDVAKLLAMKAQSMYPNIDGLPQLLATIDVHLAAEKRVGTEVDWYKILGAHPLDDLEAIRRCYRKMALILNPIKHKLVGAEGAFQLVTEAWTTLSEKAKRAAYDQKYRLWGSFKGISGGKPPIHAASQNSLFNTAIPDHKPPVPPVPPVPAAHTNPSPIPPLQPRTFWTVCRSCMTKYEYLREYRNCNLVCSKCKKPFFASEVPRPSRPGPPGVFRMPSVNLKRNHEDSTPVMREAHFGKTHAVERTVAGTAQSSWKRRCLDENKVLSDRRDMETEMASKKGIKLTNASRSLKNSFDTRKVSAAGNSRRNGIKDLSQQQLKNVLMEKARKEIHKKIHEWNESRRKLEEWKEIRKKLDERYPSSAPKNIDAEVGVKQKERTVNGVKQKERAVNGVKQKERAVNGVKPGSKEFIDSKANNTCTSADSEMPGVSMDVPDPDYHDFDGDRIEETFAENQVWAAYDNEDGMPRYYAFINEVISKDPFKMKISWLSSKTNDELAPIKWVESGFSKTTGDLRQGKRAINSSLNTFSHMVKWTKGPKGIIHIYPTKGEVWALYRNWSLDWDEFTKDEVIHQYDMVEVLDDYNDQHGVNVAPLAKAPGFKTVFRRNTDHKKIRNIPKAEMFRFSHQVPSCLLTGQEGDNAPKGFLELDPASTPMELLQLITEDPKEDVEMTIENSSKGAAVAPAGKAWPENLLVYKRKRSGGKKEQ